MESIEFASDEQSIAHNCVEGPMFNNNHEQDDGLVPTSKPSTTPPTPATKTSMYNGAVPPSNSLAEHPQVAIVTSTSNQSALAPKYPTAMCCTTSMCAPNFSFLLDAATRCYATTTFTRCSSSRTFLPFKDRIPVESAWAAAHPPSNTSSTWPYAICHETASFHGNLTSLGSRS